MTIVKNIPVEGSDGRLMATDIFYKEDQNQLPVVIYIHGFNGLKDWANFDLIATQFAEAGYFFIKMNMSHNGATLESPLEFTDLEAFGHNNYTKELYDVGQIINWICDENNSYHTFIDKDRILLLGHSRGGGIAILKSYEDKRIKALITWASIAECKTPWGAMSIEKMNKWREEGVMYYTNQRTKQQLPIYYQLFEDYENNKERLDIKNAMQHLNIPVLICHGTEDNSVSYSKALLLNEWQPHAKLFSVPSDHVFGRSHPWTQTILPDPMQIIVDVSIKFLRENN